MKIAIATIAVGLPFRGACSEGTQTKRAYCKKWGYDFVYETRARDETRPVSWSKIKLIQAILAQYDWVFWIDADTLIMDDSISANSLIDQDSSFLICEDAVGMINAGVFLVKNTSLMHELLADIYRREEFIHHGHWEQAALCQILTEDHPNKEAIKILPQRTMNSYSWETALPINEGYGPGIYHDGDFLVHLTNAKRPLKLFFLMKKYAGKLPLFSPLARLIQTFFGLLGLIHPKGKIGYLFFKTKIFG